MLEKGREEAMGKIGWNERGRKEEAWDVMEEKRKE